MFGVGHAAPEQEFNMILTVTMNPSIDTRYQLDKLIIDDVNRVTPEKTAGGKGLNVSRVLLQLGDDVLATGLLGGHMGAYMAELMDADGVKNDFVPIAGETRICLNILHEGNQTELLESGPQIAPAELEAFTAKFAELAAKADVVTLSGSLPRGVDAGYYAKLVKIAEEAGAKVLLDTSGASLEAALESDAKPELVKPNLTEINGLLSTSFTTDDVDALREALAADGRFAGIPWVVVSMGAAGSVGFHEGRAFRAKTPAIAAVNATGSGDSTIAGFAHAIAAGADDVTVLKTANTCGKLNAMDPKTGHLVMDRWDEGWTESVKRQVVKDAFYIHQHKGTTSAVRRVVEPFGFLIRIIEWWQTGEAPGTFRLDIGVQDQGITEDTYLELERLISDAKPCSRHMIGMSINLQTSGPHWVGAASYLGEEITIYPYINETIISGGTAHEGGAVHVIDTMRVNP